MKLATLACLTLAVAALANAQPRRMPRGGENIPAPIAKSDAEKKVLAVLASFQSSGDIHLNVPQNDGRMLRLLVEAVNAKHVLEFGTSTGYSGMWIGLGLLGTGGKLTTCEFDAGRAATARKYFEEAGLAKVNTVIVGDGHESVKKVKGPIDVVFIDAEKEGYPAYLEAVLPLVRPGGLILAHNVNPGMAGSGYVKAVTSNPDLETTFYLDGGGMSISLKKR